MATHTHISVGVLVRPVGFADRKIKHLQTLAVGMKDYLTSSDGAFQRRFFGPGHIANHPIWLLLSRGFDLVCSPLKKMKVHRVHVFFWYVVLTTFLLIIS